MRWFPRRALRGLLSDGERQQRDEPGSAGAVVLLPRAQGHLIGLSCSFGVAPAPGDVAGGVASDPCDGRRARAADEQLRTAWLDRLWPNGVGVGREMLARPYALHLNEHLVEPPAAVPEARTEGGKVVLATADSQAQREPAAGE